MTYKIIIITALLLVILVANPFKIQSEPLHNSTYFDEPEIILEEPEITYNSETLVDPDILRVTEITGWDIEIATYFVTEARWRRVSVFEEALPIAFVESSYRFDVINHNRNGTNDVGIFQINSNTYPFIVEKLKEEQYIFDSWERSSPEFNISAGIYYIAYLKDKHKLQSHALFSSYNRGATGARNYASRNGTYETAYSRKVKEVKKQLTDY